MKYQDKRTRVGKFMFNFTFKGSKFIMKHMWLYYILNYTWGILLTLTGWIVLGFIKLFLRKKIHYQGKFGPCYYLAIGELWGGLELGTNFLISKYTSQHTKEHECGHTFQNAIFGPFTIFLVTIPSAIRYWLDRAGKIKKAYDAIWFEGSASVSGNYYYENYLRDYESF